MTPDQRAAVLEAMARAMCRLRVEFNLKLEGREEDEAWVEGAINYGAHTWTEQALAALDAALPLIERAVLEKAAAFVEAHEEGSAPRGQRAVSVRTDGNICGLGYANAIRALAGEVR